MGCVDQNLDETTTKLAFVIWLLRLFLGRKQFAHGHVPKVVDDKLYMHE